MTETQPKAKLSQKEILTRLLNLMANAESIDKDFSLENLERIFQIPIKSFPREKDKYGFSERFSTWGYVIESSILRNNGNRYYQLYISFHGQKGSEPNKPNMSAACEMTMDDFGIKAKKLGFSIKPIKALGRAPILEEMQMTKGNLEVKIKLIPRMGSTDNWQNPGPTCIKFIQVFLSDTK